MEDIDYLGMNDDGPYYDQEMADIIADAAEKEVEEIRRSVMAEVLAEQAEEEEKNLRELEEQDAQRECADEWFHSSGRHI